MPRALSSWCSSSSVAAGIESKPSFPITWHVEHAWIVTSSKLRVFRVVDGATVLELAIRGRSAAPGRARAGRWRRVRWVRPPSQAQPMAVLARKSNRTILLCAMAAEKPYPDADELYAIAEGQAGFFVAEQAASAGYSRQLLAHHARGGRYRRIRRGLYRLVHFPPSEYEDYVALWLVLERAAVYSHETALALYGISDVNPRRTDVTLPSTWKGRRLRIPDGIVLHYDELGPLERAALGPVPLTTVTRTLVDLARAHFRPDLLRSAALEAIHRGLSARGDLAEVENALAPYGGLDP